MKNIFKKISVIIICLPFFSTLAQDNSINIKNSDVQKADSVITVMADIDISNLDLDKESTVKIYPKLKSDNNEIELPPIVINGRNKHILYRRNPDKEDFGEYRRKNNTTQLINYQQTIRYSPWMKRSEFYLDIDKCGCGRNSAEASEIAVMKLRLSIDPYVAYIKPTGESVKLRDEQGSAFLDFPVNQVAINPDFRSNSYELSKIFGSIERVRQDTNLQIISINIHGFASPEGNYQNNVRLANERSESLKKLLSKRYGISKSMLNVKYTPEDWDGVRKFIADSQFSDKEVLLNLIDSDIDLSDKETRLRNIATKDSYNDIKERCYPTLRRSDYKINYIVRGFNIDEAKEVLRTAPRQLSLQEMYMIASSLDQGDEDFEELFDIAVRMFPDDATANLNASSIAIKKRDIKAAEKYLQKADINRAETLNNLGALALLKGNVEESEQYFFRASELGLNEGMLNLRDNVK